MVGVLSLYSFTVPGLLECKGVKYGRPGTGALPRVDSAMVKKKNSSVCWWA